MNSYSLYTLYHTYEYFTIFPLKTDLSVVLSNSIFAWFESRSIIVINAPTYRKKRLKEIIVVPLDFYCGNHRYSITTYLNHSPTPTTLFWHDNLHKYFPLNLQYNSYTTLKISAGTNTKYFNFYLKFERLFLSLEYL